MQEQHNSEISPLVPFLQHIQHRDKTGFQLITQQHLALKGLRAFILETLAPLTQAVGEAWASGRLGIFEEHWFTELSKRLLRQAIANLPEVRGGPKILLTTAPGEQHVLGLLMAEAIFCLEGADCIALGTEMPVKEIARAACSHEVDMVALSFSMAYPAEKIPEVLSELRWSMPSTIALWIGGAGARLLPVPHGIERLHTLSDIPTCYARWLETREGL